jgi:choline kinase
VVSIAEGDPEPIPPLPPTEDLRNIKQFPANLSSRRLSGRINMLSNNSSRVSVASQSSIDESEGAGRTAANGHAKEGKDKERRHHLHGLHRGEHGFHRREHGHHKEEHEQKAGDGHRDKLLNDVVSWLQAEKAKRAAKKSRRRGGEGGSSTTTSSSSFRPRTSSMDSDNSNISLDQLQRILEDNMSSFGLDSLPLASPTSRRPSVLGKKRGSMKRVYSSDTEYHEGDVIVPSCDVVLDNSKTLSYSGGGATAESSASTVTLSTSKRAEKERKHWLQFKSEIVRLAHTLRLKGWRKVPLERGGEIEVERLSGALTNAVYVVSPPPGLSQPQSAETGSKVNSSKPPPKLLLRIYGPQVEHLIDRENELEILKRLSRKRIGPRMLGTFRNGRFEEYFNATTLKFEDLRVKDTSKQIAKRMRELHEGIDLLDQEIEDGPFVWSNHLSRQRNIE